VSAERKCIEEELMAVEGRRSRIKSKRGTGTKSSAPHFGAAVDAVYSPTEAAAEVLTTAAHTLTCTEKNL